MKYDFEKIKKIKKIKKIIETTVKQIVKDIKKL